MASGSMNKFPKKEVRECTRCGNDTPKIRLSSNGVCKRCVAKEL